MFALLLQFSKPFGGSRSDGTVWNSNCLSRMRAAGETGEGVSKRGHPPDPVPDRGALPAGKTWN
jgi:hypothetical protein